MFIKMYSRFTSAWSKGKDAYSRRMQHGVHTGNAITETLCQFHKLLHL